MTSTRGRIAGVGAFVIAIVLQTSLVGRLRVATVAPTSSSAASYSPRSASGPRRRS